MFTRWFEVVLSSSTELLKCSVVIEVVLNS